jgi:NADPH-dependent 2,4-dienoyl-CoA reductase/sulfur reductase-like enzyme/nitrite reductase/ring-hydroxylating ferredoxin subunit
MPQHDAAALTDLPDGGMKSVEAGSEKILLIRDRQTVHAIGATCPHAGAPLEQGVRNGDRIVCPWHKATFCIRTGALLEPPAVDRIPSYQARIEGQRILVSIPPDQPPAPGADQPAPGAAPDEPAPGAAPDEPAPGAAPDRRVFAIIGAGAAGALAAQTLREAGFNGRIVMLDRHNRVPYDRTVLSKYFLSGESNAEKSPLQSQAYYRQHRIERRTAEVTALDAAQKRIECADGFTLTYDAALLATGAAPSLPKLPGAHLRNVFLLRSREDADAILAQAERSERAVVLGASFIGMEVAASLRERGLEVTVVGKETAPFEQQLGARIGNVFVSLHRKRGVSFRLGQEISGLEGDGRVQTVRLADGERLEADLVVIGFGVRPVTGYLLGIALNPDGSVPVDATLRAADGLYAAGDIARFPLQGDGPPIRVEHWRVAEQHGRIAGLNMAAPGEAPGEAQAARYDAVPVFWTIQYLKRLDYIGHATDWDDIIVHGDLEKPEFLAYYVKDGVVIAAAGLDRDQDTAALIELFNQRRAWTPEALGSAPSRHLLPPDR